MEERGISAVAHDELALTASVNCNEPFIDRASLTDNADVVSAPGYIAPNLNGMVGRVPFSR